MGTVVARPQEPEDEWLAKLTEVHGREFDENYWKLLEGNLAIWACQVGVGGFWNAAGTLLEQWKTEYHTSFGSHLLSQPQLPPFVQKSVISIKEKLLRTYTLKPDSLEGSISKQNPFLPNINDLLRTRIVCPYIDGVEFIANKLLELGKNQGLVISRERQGKLEGYFAQHIIVQQHLVYQITGVPTMVNVACEVQVATEMSTKMWEVSHTFYERNRRKGIDAEQWQWNPSDPQFISHQLGHMIHLVDGLLVQLRDAKKEP